MENKFNVYADDCPSRQVLELISNKWTILIIEMLAQKTYRFGELKRGIGGISQKVLAQTLRNLEAHGFVLRRSYPVLPLKVEYSLTVLGKSLSAVCQEITDWAEQNIIDIKEAQKNYAQRTVNESNMHSRTLKVQES